MLCVYTELPGSSRALEVKSENVPCLSVYPHPRKARRGRTDEEPQHKLSRALAPEATNKHYKARGGGDLIMRRKFVGCSKLDCDPTGKGDSRETALCLHLGWGGDSTYLSKGHS